MFSAGRASTLQRIISARSVCSSAKSGKRTGVLLVNLGTPDAPTQSAVRRYLAEFLSDPRVVDTPRWIWYPILHGLVLPLRSSRTARHYKSVWTDQGSPLRVTSQKLAEKVQQELPDYDVLLAMRYGSPSIRDALEHFGLCGTEKLIAVPLYPQYASSTVGTSFDSISSVLATWRYIPSVHFVSGYHTHPLYIKALANRIRESGTAFSKNHPLLFSYHGLPRRHVDRGDPYFKQCHETTNLVAKELMLESDAYQTVFQSRFGYDKWLEPACDKVLTELPTKGVKHVTIVAPGFAVDCLETIEEIAIHYRDKFLTAGGETLSYIPALNDSKDHVTLLKDLVQCCTRE